MLPAQAESVLQSGDLVFTSIPNPLYRRVARATGCPASHVGIAFRDPDGRWRVAESKVPLARYSALDRFLARSDRGWAVIRRLRGGLTPEQVARLRAACDLRIGRPYHLGFRYDSQWLFCSKLVYDAYVEAVGVEVGDLETFGELLRRRPEEPLTFWRWWFLGSIPWSRRTVTPASQMESSRLTTVAASGEPGSG